LLLGRYRTSVRHGRLACREGDRRHQLVMTMWRRCQATGETDPLPTLKLTLLIWCVERQREPAAPASAHSDSQLHGAKRSGSAVVSRCSSKESCFLFLSEAIALTLNHEGMTVMEQPVEDRRGEDLVAKNGAPLRDDLVGGDE
jgi:hypothetical protein